MEMGNIISGKIISHNRDDEVFSFLKIRLSRKNGKKGIELFFAVNKKNIKFVTQYYLHEIQKIFFYNINEATVARLLKNALNELKRDYYFIEAMKIAQDAIKAKREEDKISDLIYNIIGPELSEEGREIAIEYARYDVGSATRRLKRRNI